MMLALGDALACALMVARGFTKENFSEFHPGGKLGNQLRKVSEIMHSGDELPLCALATSMKDVLVLMTPRDLDASAW